MTGTDSYAVVIPARYQSSRFPGKPLVDLCGKPMIQHVWERCCHAVGAAKVQVATDNDTIQATVEGFGGQVVRTRPDCLTGTDRVAEANQLLDCDFIVNVQGDEPTINPDDIRKVVRRFQQTGQVTNAMCRITTAEEFHSLTVPKVVCTPAGRLLYMSRAGIPLTKSGDFVTARKQVCIYAFGREHLAFFHRQSHKSPLEQIEDIEILRFLEGGFAVDMVEVEAGSVAVDVPDDVARAEAALQRCDFQPAII